MGDIGLNLIASLRPHWRKIKYEINNSNALFFLVGRQLVKMQENHDDNWDRTQNWIAFEIGIACQRKIDVWVICDKNIKINFPIPYVSAYIPKFDAKKDNELIKLL